MIPTWRKTDNGDIFINQLSRYVKGALLVPRANANPVIIAAAGANPTFGPPVIYEADEGSIMEVYSMIGIHGAAVPVDVQRRMTLQITDLSWRRRFMNRPILVNHVFSTNNPITTSALGVPGGIVAPGQPLSMDTTIFLEGQQALEFQYFNNSAAGVTNFSTALQARKFQNVAIQYDTVKQYTMEMRNKKRYLTPYWLTSDAAINIPAQGTTQAFFTATRDVYVLVTKILIQTISTGAAGDVNEAVQFRLFDSANERPLQNQPITVNTGGGTGNFPFVLAEPLLIEPVTRVRMELTSLITDQPVEVFVTMVGTACYAGNFNPYTPSIERAMPAPAYWGNP